MDTLPISDVKTRLTELVTQVEMQRDRITITRNGKPAALLVSVGEWESITETLDVLSNPQTMANLREAADSETFSTDDIDAILRARADGHTGVA